MSTQNSTRNGANPVSVVATPRATAATDTARTVGWRKLATTNPATVDPAPEKTSARPNHEASAWKASFTMAGTRIWKLKQNKPSTNVVTNVRRSTVRDRT